MKDSHLTLQNMEKCCSSSLIKFLRKWQGLCSPLCLPSLLTWLPSWLTALPSQGVPFPSRNSHRWVFLSPPPLSLSFSFSIPFLLLRKGILQNWPITAEQRLWFYSWSIRETNIQIFCLSALVFSNF